MWTPKRLLPQGYLEVPQRDQSISTIDIKDTDSAPKLLGVELAFDGETPKAQLDRLARLGKEWATRVRKAKFMSVSDNWKSAAVQLKPKLKFAIVSVCAPPKKLEEVSMVIHYHLLSPLSINQNINK